MSPPKPPAPEQALAQLQALSKDLGLVFEQQDWGLINADGTRVAEFMRHYEEKATPGQRLHLAELIFASANELLMDDPDDDVHDVLGFVRRHVHELKLQLEYWRHLDPDEFPLAARLMTLVR